uniref:Retrovirus-related Pol polyprotein from transposon TNT 1-94 n=1 Tax=Tanacetum cinerariifolium TaxID=118510 RepID=A0A699IHY5_TANCI|nr:retrovirus-related Pol polyprotein from transposon TNT 1-94 [Tanacetum cinerariifolium]
MTADFPQSLKYRGGQLDVAPILKVENFTNLKKRIICHRVGIELQLKNIILNGPYVQMTTGVQKPKAQWTYNKRKAANLDQRLRSLIMFVPQDDQMNSFINCETKKSTWDDLILYHEGPFDVKENKVMDLKLCYNTFRFKESENITQTFTRYKALMNKDIRSSQEYMNDLEMDFHERTLLAKSRKFFKKDEEEVSSYDNEVVKLKVLMVRADDESANDTKVSTPNVERPWLSEVKGFNLPNHDTGRILPSSSNVELIDPSATLNITNSLVTDYIVHGFPS